MNDRTEFLCLRWTDYRENDVILAGLCPSGQMSFIAKGLKKPTAKNAYALQLYSLCSAEYDEKPERSLQLLKTASPLASNRRLREDLDAQAVCAVIAEVLLKLPDGEDLYTEGKEIFDALQNGADPLSMLNLFLTDMLDREGNRPETDGCVHCGSSSGIIALSVREGGFICRNCYPRYGGMILPAGLLKNLRIYCHATTAQIPVLKDYPLSSVRLAGILLDFMETYCGISTISRKFLENWFHEPAEETDPAN